MSRKRFGKKRLWISRELLSSLEKFFVLGAEEGGIEGGVVAAQGRLKSCVVLFGMEKAGGDFGIDEFYVVLPNSGHA